MPGLRTWVGRGDGPSEPKRMTTTPKMTRLVVHWWDESSSLYDGPEVRAIALYVGEAEARAWKAGGPPPVVPSWFELTEAERRVIRTRAAQEPVCQEMILDCAECIGSCRRPNVWTVRARWPDGSTEELHVGATNEDHARVRSADLLAQGGYQTNWEVTEVIGPRLRQYTLLARWPDGRLEELNVDAPHEWAACREGAAQLRRGCEPGGKIIEWRGPRPGFYL